MKARQELIEVSGGMDIARCGNHLLILKYELMRINIESSKVYSTKR